MDFCSQRPGGREGWPTAVQEPGQRIATQEIRGCCSDLAAQRTKTCTLRIDTGSQAICVLSPSLSSRKASRMSPATTRRSDPTANIQAQTLRRAAFKQAPNRRTNLACRKPGALVRATSNVVPVNQRHVLEQRLVGVTTPCAQRVDRAHQINDVPHRSARHSNPFVGRYLHHSQPEIHAAATGFSTTSYSPNSPRTNTR